MLSQSKKLLFVCLITIICLSGCTNIFKVKEPNLEEKVNQEIEYLDSEIVSMINTLNNITYTDYEVISTDIKQSSKASNTNEEMNQSGEKTDTKQKDELETEGEKGTAESQTKEQGDESSSSEAQEKVDNSSTSKQSSENQKSEEGTTSSKESSETQKSAENSSSQSSEGGSDSNETVSNSHSEVQTFKLKKYSVLDSSDKNIDWDEMKANIEVIYGAWVTIKMDLEEIGVSSEKIDEFINVFNEVLVSIANEDEVEAFDNLTNLYSIMSDFVKEYSTSEYIKNTVITKMYVLKAYNNIIKGEWEAAYNENKQGISVFENVTNNSEINENKKVDVERVKVLLVEFENSINFKDEKVCKLKYKNLIQELSIL